MSAASSAWSPRHVVLLLACLGVATAFAIGSPPFRSPSALLDQSCPWVEIGILVPGSLLVILTGGIDLAVGSVLALTGVTVLRLHAEAGLPIAVAAACGLLVGAAAGAVHGLIITRARIPDLVVTLATMAIWRGLAQAVARNRVYSGLPEGYRFLGDGLVAGVPVQWLLLAALFVLVAAVLHRTRLGRQIYAVGAAPRAARLAGVPVDRARVIVYTLSGLGAAVAALVYVARADAARSDDATGAELDAITCVVLGGASIAGGRGSATGVLLGFLLLGLLRTGLDLSGVPEIWQRLATGTLLVTIAALNERLARAGSRDGPA